MSRMSDLHYKQQQEPQEDCPSIQYHMTYQYIGKWTPSLSRWYNKLFANPKDYRTEYFQYIKAEKTEIPF